jgi:outer membrane protein
MIKNSLIIVSLLFGIAGFVMSMKNHERNTVYIHMEKVYNGFNLSKELNKELGKVIKVRKAILDSLYDNLRRQSQLVQMKAKKEDADVAALRILEEELLYKEKTFEKEDRAATESCNEKIWNQINQYMEEYGKKKGYVFILGANGQGNIMYGSDSNNISEEVITYMNERYEDKIK